MKLTFDKGGNRKKVPNHYTIEVNMYDLQPSVSASQLRVRLCSASTGNCTSYKEPTGSNYMYVKFTNMYGGGYYVDVRDTISGSVSGQLYAIGYQ
ncbi:hypothetical protein [Paludifilum halophilum]|uniref:Uncharacterized protein n=1 Tax=Paludifilum halophilum TaxID=1642702 RepID=A0A235BC94_9BACL|nr:hypothetical protein [Paludifilum halophilum]OYD09659.1 hypothetical protein CHM34_01240 [Paludifilum halophilum]